MKYKNNFEDFIQDIKLDLIDLDTALKEIKVGGIMNGDSLKDSDIRGKIDIAFARLIGPLAIMNELKSYESSQEEIHNLLDIVTKWGAKFQSTQNLSFINSDEILNVYNRLDALKDKFLFDPNLGLENELSDEIVIWIYELMELRKIQIG